MGGEEVAKCGMVICDPSYAEPTKVSIQSKIIRVICILGEPIPNTYTKEHNPARPVQIILPQSAMKRRNDVYIMMVSWTHKIAAKDKYVAIVSTVVETSDPEKEVEPALKLLGPVIEKFTSVSEFREPTNDGLQDQ